MKEINKSVIRMVWYKDTLKDIRDYCERQLGTNQQCIKIKQVIDARLNGEYFDFYDDSED